MNKCSVVQFIWSGIFEASQFYSREATSQTDMLACPFGDCREGFYEENGCICKSDHKITNWVIKESRWEIRKRGECEETWIVLNIGVYNMESEVATEIPMGVIQSGNIIKYLPNELMVFELSDAKRRWFIREYPLTQVKSILSISLGNRAKRKRVQN